MYEPKTKEGIEDLEQRIATVHADLVTHRIQNLNCPIQQKLKLLDTIMKAISQQEACAQSD